MVAGFSKGSNRIFKTVTASLFSLSFSSNVWNFGSTQHIFFLFYSGPPSISVEQGPRG